LKIEVIKLQDAIVARDTTELAKAQADCDYAECENEVLRAKLIIAEQALRDIEDIKLCDCCVESKVHLNIRYDHSCAPTIASYALQKMEEKDEQY